MFSADPTIKQTRTKVGESYTLESNYSDPFDPIVGQTRTKVGETYTKVNDYASTGLGTSYYSTYYTSRPRHYSHGNTGGGFAAAVIFGVVLIGFIALIASTPSHSHRPRPKGGFIPNPPEPPHSYYNRHYGQFPFNLNFGFI